ncbi:SDR family oxidoreductase [Variovorax sp. UC122_21]|uniref:SDR family oxidoreductase n=1 Tax=Variovorax sp. UC122_21 TaxID=3374554 RepID=UPI0037584639
MRTTAWPRPAWCSSPASSRPRSAPTASASTASRPAPRPPRASRARPARAGMVGDADLPKIPLRRLATVEDMAGPLEFLATDLSSYVTGQCISVCGGKVLTPS